MNLTANLPEFNRFVDGVIAKLGDPRGEVLDRTLRAIALKLLDRIIKKSPVDTGRSRAAWYVAIRRLGGSGNPGGDPKAVEDGLAKGDLRWGGGWLRPRFIEVINGVNYAIWLEMGHSRQAPSGMVRISMLEMAGRREMEKELMENIRTAWLTESRKVSSGLTGRTF